MARLQQTSDSSARERAHGASLMKNIEEQKHKNWFTTTQDQFDAKTEELSNRFKTEKGKQGKLSQLISNINEIRRVTVGDVKTSS